MEEEDEEAEQADLRRDVEGARNADPPDAPIAKRAREHAVLVRRFSPKQHGADERGQEAPGGESLERGTHADVGVERRQRACSDRAAERHRRLTNSEGEASFVFAEPRHHGAPAGGVDTGAERAGNGARGDEVPERGCVGSAHHGPGGSGLSEEDHGTLPDPIGDDPPEQEGGERAEVERGEHHAHLRQAEVVAVPDRRGDRRQAEQDRRERRLWRGSSSGSYGFARAWSSRSLRISSALGPFPSAPGTSSRTGSCWSFGCARNVPRPSPIKPSRMLSWRSRFEPSGALASFAWRARKRSRPIRASTSWTTS